MAHSYLTITVPIVSEPMKYRCFAIIGAFVFNSIVSCHIFHPFDYHWQTSFKVVDRASCHSLLIYDKMKIVVKIAQIEINQAMM